MNKQLIQDNHGILAVFINAFSRFAAVRTLVSSFYMLAHYLPICLFFPLTVLLFPSFIFFLSLSLSRRLCLLLFVLHSVFFSDFLFIHPCIYLSVLFRPCVVCVCIRATSGIE